MKHALRIVGLSSLVCVALFVAAPLPAQQWSDAQKDVWKSVENYWALDAKGDLEGFMSYFDASYVGWSYEGGWPWSPVAPGGRGTPACLTVGVTGLCRGCHRGAAAHRATGRR